MLHGSLHIPFPRWLGGAYKPFPQRPWDKLLVSAAYESMQCCDFRDAYCYVEDKCFTQMCKDVPTLVPEEVAPPRRFHDVTVHQISLHPHALFIPDFVSAADCDALVQAAMPGLERSVTFTDLSKGVMSATDWRKSDGGTVARTFPPLRRVHAKLAALLRVPESHFEEVSILRYRGQSNGGERYVPHNDFFDEDGLIKGEQRMYSLVVFLNDVPRGGETIFPRAGYKVAPRKGGALLWKNVHPPDNIADDLSWHGGCYPDEGLTKWIGTIWVHDGPVAWHVPLRNADAAKAKAPAAR